MIIGISGKIGTGKSHVTKYLKRKLKFLVIDAEKIRFELAEEPAMQSTLIKTFGSRIMHTNGTIHHTKLLAVTGKDNLRIKVLSEYMDKAIGDKIKEIIGEQDDNYIVETTDPIRQGLNSIFDVSVLVVTPKILAYNRLLKKYPKDVIDNLWKWNKNTKDYDFIIENKSSIKNLREDVDELIAEMFKKGS